MNFVDFSCEIFLVQNILIPPDQNLSIPLDKNVLIHIYNGNIQIILH